MSRNLYVYNLLNTPTNLDLSDEDLVTFTVSIYGTKVTFLTFEQPSITFKL